jgi:hypothetical protein
VREQEVARLVAERGDIERGPRRIRLLFAERMNAPDESPHPLERVAPIEIGGASATSFEYREPKTVERVQRLPIETRFS